MTDQRSVSSRESWVFGNICRHIAIDERLHGRRTKDATIRLLLQMNIHEGRLFAVELKAAKNHVAEVKCLKDSNKGLLARVAGKELAEALNVDGWGDVLEYRDYEGGLFDYTVVAKYCCMIEVSERDLVMPVKGTLCNDELLLAREETAQEIAGWTKDEETGEMRPPPHPDRESSKPANFQTLTAHKNADGRATLIDKDGLTLGQDVDALRFTRGLDAVTLAERPKNLHKAEVKVKGNAMGSMKKGKVTALQKRKATPLDGAEEDETEKKKVRLADSGDDAAGQEEDTVAADEVAKADEGEAGDDDAASSGPGKEIELVIRDKKEKAFLFGMFGGRG